MAITRTGASGYPKPFSLDSRFCVKSKAASKESWTASNGKYEETCLFCEFERDTHVQLVMRKLKVRSLGNIRSVLKEVDSRRASPRQAASQRVDRVVVAHAAAVHQHDDQDH